MSRVSSSVGPGPHWGKLPAPPLLSGRSGAVSQVPQVTVSRAGLPVAGTLGAPVAGPGRGLGLVMGVLTAFPWPGGTLHRGRA